MKPEKYGLAGLYTNPNAVLTDAAKRGALKQAHNVAFRQPGIAEPRSGFKVSHSPSLLKVLKILPYSTTMVHAGIYNEASQKTVNTAGTEITDESSTALSWALDFVNGVEARGNLYMSTLDAVRRITSASDVTAERAHALTQPSLLVGTAAGSALLDDTSVAYRVTISRKDANGVIVTSKPSARAIQHVTGGAQSGSLLIYNSSSSIQAGDTIRVYRSAGVPYGVRPSDDCRLVVEYVAPTTAATYTIADNVADVDRGAALYTNPTREGIDRQNEAPPRARALALFRGSLFAGNVQYPAYLDLAVKEGGDLSGVSTGVGFRTTSTAFTNGATTATVTSATGLKIGMVFQFGGFTSRITNISGTTITFANAWTGSTGSQNIGYIDSIRIKSASEDKYYPAITLARFQACVNDVTDIGCTPSAFYRVESIGDGQEYLDAATVYGGRRSVRILGRLPTTATFEVFATHGSSYEPALPEPTETTGKACAQDVFPNAVAWSKNEEPEHFMLGRYLRIGDTSPILALIPAGDYLYILKGRGKNSFGGVYQLSGVGERSDWHVRELSRSHYLVHPDAATAVDDEVAFLSNAGLASCGPAGMGAALDEAIADQTIDVGRDLSFETVLTGTSYNARAFVALNHDRELLCGLPKQDTANGEAVHKVFCKNLDTDAWATWFDDDAITCAVQNPADSLTYLGSATAGTVLGERDRTTDSFPYAELQYAITITGLVGTTITISAGSGWTPAVGDLVNDGASTTIVTAITSATVFDVLSGSGLSGGAVAYKAFTSRIEWLPQTGGSGAVFKRYRGVSLHWDEIFGLYSWALNFDGTANGDDQDIAETIDTWARSARALDTETWGLNQDVAMQPRLHVTLEIANADSRWRLAGMAQELTGGSSRVWR